MTYGSTRDKTLQSYSAQLAAGAWQRASEHWQDHPQLRLDFDRYAQPLILQYSKSSLCGTS